MRRLDVAPGEWVRLRNRDLAKVEDVVDSGIVVRPAALNGFGHVLWWELPLRLGPDGRGSDLPSMNDVIALARIKDTLFGYKVIESPLCYYVVD